MDDCATAWAVLEQAVAPPPFQTLAWARAWLRHYGVGAVPCLVCVDAPQPMIVPLVFTRAGPFRVLRLLGSGPSDYLGPLAARLDADAWSRVGALLRPLLGEVDRLELDSVALTSEECSAFSRAVGRPSIDRVYERCPAIDTTGDWESFLRGRSKRFRANWKRTERQAVSHGETSLAREPVSPRLFDECIEVERDSWKWERGLAFLREPRSREFIRDALLEAAIPHELFTCRIDGQLAGFAVVFRSARRRYYYLPSFRERFPGVGGHLLGHVVKDSFDSDCEEFDFLRGDEGYKLAWSTHVRDVHQIVVAGRGLRGRVARGLVDLRWRLARSARLHAWRERWLVRTSGIGAGD